MGRWLGDAVDVTAASAADDEKSSSVTKKKLKMTSDWDKGIVMLLLFL